MAPRDSAVSLGSREGLLFQFRPQRLKREAKRGPRPAAEMPAREGARSHPGPPTPLLPLSLLLPLSRRKRPAASARGSPVRTDRTEGRSGPPCCGTGQPSAAQPRGPQAGLEAGGRGARAQSRECIRADPAVPRPVEP